MEDGRTRFKQEPLSPGAASRHGHDLMAMQQTYHQGEALSRTGTQCALDMSQSGRTATIAAGMPYIPDTMTSYALTAHDVTPAYAIQDRNLMLGMYGYAPVISEGKGAGHVDLLTNGMESTEVNGCDGTGPPENVQPKLRNTALPGMGKRSHLPKRYKCAMCAYRTRYKSDLNRHVRKHAVATFNCEICNMPFKTIGNVEFHKRKEHADLLVTAATATSGPGKDQPPKHSCKHCDYSTSYSSDLTRHVRKHFSSKFHCALCNRPFMTFSSLATHKRTAHNTAEVIESEGDGGIGGTLVDGGVIEESEVLVGDGVIEEGGASDVEMVEGFLASPKTGDARDRSGGLSMQKVNGDHKDNMIAVEDENRNITEKNHVPDEETVVSKDQSSPSKVSNSPDNVICTKYTCEYCDKSFGRKLVLEYHLKNIHKIVKSGQEDTDVFVEYPDDDYDLALDMSIQELENATSDSLADRALDPSGKLRHQCQLCAYATNYKSTFDRHVRKHDLECHICDVCRMPFITFGHLQRHIRDNHPEQTQSGARKESADGHQERTQVSARKESAEGRSAVYDFPPNDPHTRGTNPSSPSRCKLSQSPFHWMTVNKPLVQSSGKGEIGGSVGTKFNWAGQRRVSSVEEGVTTSPPTSGRYAKLVSDYDSFAEQPFACALCFYRTGDVSSLVEHAENHLTGCSLTPVPDTCMFRVGSSMLNGGADLKRQMRYPVLPTHSVYAPTSTGEHGREERSGGFATPNEISQPQFVYSNHTRALVTKNMKSGQGTKSQGRCVPESQDQGHLIFSQEKNLPIPYRQQTEIMGQQSSKVVATNVTVADSQKRNDRMIPTFSVHYRKDKTNKVRPYLCLLCRKRFRHLMLLKQHFKVTHSESQVGTPRFYTCRMCKEVFNNPMLLQEHHDINH